MPSARCPSASRQRVPTDAGVPAGNWPMQAKTPGHCRPGWAIATSSIPSATPSLRRIDSGSSGVPNARRTSTGLRRRPSSAAAVAHRAKDVFVLAARCPSARPTGADLPYPCGRLLINICVRAASLAQPRHVRAGKVGRRSWELWERHPLRAGRGTTRALLECRR